MTDKTRTTKIGGKDEVVTSYNSPLLVQNWTDDALAARKNTLEFKLSMKPHGPANVVDELAKVNAEIESRAS